MCIRDSSKATGFPIASVSTKLASGITMDELPYWRKGSLEKYEPYGDYVVVKMCIRDRGNTAPPPPPS